MNYDVPSNFPKLILRNQMEITKINKIYLFMNYG